MEVKMRNIRNMNFPRNMCIYCDTKAELRLVLSILFHDGLMIRGGSFETTVSHWSDYISPITGSVCLYPFYDSYSTEKPTNSKQYTMYTVTSFIEEYNDNQIPLLMDKLNKLLT